LKGCGCIADELGQLIEVNRRQVEGDGDDAAGPLSPSA
jgi:hypothetical protein